MIFAVNEIHFGWGGMGETRALLFMVMSDQLLVENWSPSGTVVINRIMSDL
jgi:hypothetical protein